jgi:acyl-CoA thioester hydrolase
LTAEREPLTWSEDVRPEWIDYNGHLSEGYYVLVFGHASDAAMAAIGMTPEYLVQTATSLFSVEAHVRYLDQIPPGARLDVRTSVIGVTAKLLWLWHEMWAEGRLRATEEVLMVHVDTAAGRASPFPPDLRTCAERLLVPPPEHASRRIAVG